MNQKPLVGILPLYDPKRESLWMLPAYFEAIRTAGGFPIMLPPQMTEEELEQTLALCAGFLFTGGQDVNPALYGAERSPLCGQLQESRDEFETRLFARAYALDKPVLGICRGLQLMNVALGGTLYQHLPAEMPGSLDHDMTAPYNRVVHTVSLEPETPLQRLLKQTVLGVNSYHHQGIQTLGRGLIPMARAEDGLIEAIACADRKFIWAVQWHPEYFYQLQTHGLPIFQAFVSACYAGEAASAWQSSTSKELLPKFASEED